MNVNDIVKEKAHVKMWAKIQGLNRKIEEQKSDLRNNSYNPFIPKELHEQVLEGNEKELILFKYLLNLVEEDYKPIKYPI